MDENAPYTPPQTPLPPPASSDPVAKDKNENTLGIVYHLLAFAQFALIVPCGNIIGPLVLWLLKRAESPYIEELQHLVGHLWGDRRSVLLDPDWFHHRTDPVRRMDRLRDHRLDKGERREALPLSSDDPLHQIAEGPPAGRHARRPDTTDTLDVRQHLGACRADV